jgi:hypothetical protein
MSAGEAKACVDELYRSRTFARLASEIFLSSLWTGNMTGKNDD